MCSLLFCGILTFLALPTHRGVIGTRYLSSIYDDHFRVKLTWIVFSISNFKLQVCALLVALMTPHLIPSAREVQGECRAELARAMLSRSLHSQRISFMRCKITTNRSSLQISTLVARENLLRKPLNTVKKH